MILFYHLIWNLTNRNFYFWLIKCFAINFDILFTPKHLGNKKWWKRRIRVYSSTQNVQNLLIITGKLFNFINDVFKLEDNPKSFSTFIRNKEIIFNSWYLLSNNLLTQHIFKLLILSDISTSFRVPFSYLMHKVHSFNLGFLHLQINFYLYLFNSLITVIGILFTNARRIIFKTAKALKAMALPLILRFLILRNLPFSPLSVHLYRKLHILILLGLIPQKIKNLSNTLT